MNLNHQRWYRILRFYLCDVFGFHTFTIDGKGQPRCLYCDHKAYTVRNKFGEPEFVTFKYWWWKLWNEEKPKEVKEAEHVDLVEARKAYNDAYANYCAVCYWIAKEQTSDISGMMTLAHTYCNDVHVHAIQRTLLQMEGEGKTRAKTLYPITQKWEYFYEKGFPK